MNERTSKPIYEVRAADGEEGLIRGLASKFNNYEQAKSLEIILPGAFKRSLNNQKQFPLLWQHDHKEVIGSWTGYESGRGLEMDPGHITMTARGADAYKLVKSGDMVGISIGFQIVPDKIDNRKNPDGSEYTYLREVKLMEASIVTFAADKYAQIEAVRSMDMGSMTKEEWIAAKIKLLMDEGKTQEEAIGQAEAMYTEMMKGQHAKDFILSTLNILEPETIRTCINHLTNYLADPKADASTQQQPDTQAPGEIATAVNKDLLEMHESLARMWSKNGTRRIANQSSRTSGVGK